MRGVRGRLRIDRYRRLFRFRRCLYRRHKFQVGAVHHQKNSLGFEDHKAAVLLYQDIRGLQDRRAKLRSLGPEDHRAVVLHHKQDLVSRKEVVLLRLLHYQDMQGLGDRRAKLRSLGPGNHRVVVLHHKQDLVCHTEVVLLRLLHYQDMQGLGDRRAKLRSLGPEDHRAEVHLCHLDYHRGMTFPLPYPNRGFALKFHSIDSQKLKKLALFVE
jgi:hypothetical protein